jgi:peptide/nickel transport system ATP-binding protein
MTVAGSGAPLLEVKSLQKLFPIRRGFLRRVVGHVRAVDGVTFHVERGETLALVGESGCGKTTTSRCVLRAVTPTAGQILFRTTEDVVLDVATLPKSQLRPLRRQMQMIFQDPFSSLNPRRTLLDIVAEPLVANGVGNRAERTERVAELLRLVGLRPEYMRRYPHAFSGGPAPAHRHRAGACAEPAPRGRRRAVSALDVSVQAQILNLMLDLQQQLGLTYLFVAHDLSVVKHVSDRVAVMYVGQIVEMAETEPLFTAPRIRTPRRCSPLCPSPIRACARNASSWRVRWRTRRIRRPAATSIRAAPTRSSDAAWRHPRSSPSCPATSWRVTGRGSSPCAGSAGRARAASSRLFSAQGWARRQRPR